MRCSILGAFLALIGGLAWASTARADAIALPSGPAKIGPAQSIVIGQVVGIEDQDVEAKTYPTAANKSKYRIAILQITETLKGDAKQKTVRVGFLPTNSPPFKSGYNLQLTTGQAGLYFLHKHHEGNFFTVPMFGTFISSQFKENYDRELEITRKTLKVLNNPLVSLKAAAAEQRLEAAYLLVTTYRTASFIGPSQQEPINAEESKLILKTLLEADWDMNKYQGEKFQQHPAMLFNRLNLTSKDGWSEPKDGLFAPANIQTAKNWLEKNWQTYQIKKFVTVAAKESPKVGSSAGPGL